MPAAESYPDDLRYNEAHDWARVDGDGATFGITWYAQDTLGEVVYYSPAAVGTVVSKDGEYGELESTKAVSPLISPLAGEVTEVNDALEGSESTVNDDPYGQGWLIKVRLSEPSEADELLDATAYSAHIAGL
jgi:glycine cleavage system H protein